MENKRFITVLGLILLLIIALPIINYVGGKKGREMVAKFDEAYGADKYTFIELARDKCSYCIKQAPIIEDLANNYGLEYLYIDTNAINNTQLNHILEKIKVDYDDFGTPTMAVIGKNEVQESIIGYKNEDYLANILNKYELIKNYGMTDLKEISYSEYYKLLKSKNTSVIYLGRNNSADNEFAISQLKRASYETGVQIYSLDVYDVYMAETYSDKATDEQKAIAKKFMASLSLFDDGLTTPAVLIVKNGKLVASKIQSGYTQIETSSYVSFLKENKLAKSE